MTDVLELCDRVLDLVDGRAEAAVTVNVTTAGLTRFANSMIHQNVAESTVSVTLRVAADGRVATVDSTRTGGDDLRSLVEQALEAASVRPVDPDWPGVAPAAEPPDVEHDDAATRDPDPDERAAIVRAFVDAGPGLRAAGYVDSAGTTTAFANTAGQRVAGRSTRATIDGIHQTDTSAGKGHRTSVRLRDLDGAEVGRTAARLAADARDPVDLEPGRYPVVLSPECVATIAVFLDGYGFNGKMVEEQQSFVDLGAGQFDPAISIWDDATDPRSLGIPWDAEGTPKRRLDLVREGVTVGVTYDRRTARRAGAESTGHAVPGGETWGSVASNVFVAPGSAAVAEMVAGLDRGLVVTEFNYCRILDPKTQVVTGLTRNGTFLVERGEVVGPVANLRFTQSFVEALSPGRVLGVSPDTRFADSEFGPGAVVAPTLHLAEWNFTGGARG